MKLIECYVNNFGKLSDFSYRFRDGLNVIQRENGFGKSTLAAFIKSMLFGLEDTKRQGLSENDRKKYEPWQGGAWGGSLTFESCGKEYRIERSFSKKSSLDEIKIYNLETGKLTDELSDKEPGEILLGIDRDGFERTVFLSERSIDEKKVNNTVSAKLSRLTGVAFDMTELDAAVKLLEEERKHYKRQGGNGTISEISEKISELEYRKSELLSLEAKHEEDAKGILQKESELRLLRANAEKEVEKEKKLALLQERYKEYKRKLSEKNELCARTEKILEFFGGKLPRKETLYEASSLKEEILKLQKDAHALQESIASHPPHPTEKELEETAFLAFKTKEKQDELQAFEEKKLNTGACKSRKSKLFAIIGAAFIAFGALLAFVFLPLVLISVFGIALLLVGLFSAKRNASVNEYCEAALSLSRQIAENEEKLSKFYTLFGLGGSGSDFAIAELRRRIKEKEIKLSSLKRTKEKLTECQAKYGRITALFPIIKEYPISELTPKIDTYAYIFANAERLSKECKEFSDTFDFSDVQEKEQDEQKHNISDTIILKERELTLLKNDFSLDDLALEELDEINASLEKLRESESDAKYKFETIKKTKLYLEAAKDSLTAKYLGKTRDAFQNTLK
ncbi:MAG: hypothetical protein IJW38_00450 [Clostridia bacterium]|nr:hypothetical protein [Clostridia bacterium]